MSCCNNPNPIGKLAEAAIAQNNPFAWFRDGLKGLIKCFGKQQNYSDEDIVANREVCKNCEFSTKTDGKLTITSQCMAINPETGSPCGCFITCKTQIDKCPLSKWQTVPITVTKVSQPINISNSSPDIEL